MLRILVVDDNRDTLRTYVKSLRRKDNDLEVISPQAFLHETLVKLWQDIEDKTSVLVILFDDLENFAVVPEILMTLKSVLSMDSLTQSKILVGLASTSANWLEITSIQKHHPLSRYFLSRVVLAPLTKAELQETVCSSLDRTGVSFSQEVMKNIFEYSGGHPFEMQLLCYHLFKSHISRQVEIDIWDKALQDTVTDVGIAIFEKWCLDLSADEAKILRLLAEEEKPVLPEKLTTALGTTDWTLSLNSVEDVLNKLLQKKLIARDIYGNFEIQDRMFCTYITITLSQIFPE